MSLKNLISTLIESAFTSKKSFISNQAMPGSTSESYEYENNENVTFVAPTDGYLTIGSTPDDDGKSFIVSWGDIESSIQNSAGTPTLGDLAISVPMRKGSTKYFSVKAPRFIRFFSTVGGGGIKRLLSQTVRCVLGGAICLKTSSAHSLKRYLRTRRATLALKRSRKKRTELISANKPQVTTQPLAMDISVSMCKMSTRLLISIQKTIVHEKQPSEFRTAIFQVLERYLLEKEIEHSGTETKSRPSYGSFLLREVNSLIATEVCHV